MITVRTDAGQDPVNVTVTPAHALQKHVVENESTASRTDAAGASEGTTSQHTDTAAIVPE